MGRIQISNLDRRLLLGCLFASGFSGLAYEILWTRWFGLVFGTMAISVSAVLAAFFLGMAIGSYLISRSLPSVRRPLVVYAVLEGVIALFAACSHFLIRSLPALEASFAGWSTPVVSGMRFAVALLLLLVPTAAMGATLPLMLAALARSNRDAAPTTALVYGLNTLGAVLGAYTTSYWLLLHLGSIRTLTVVVLLNLTVAVVVIARYRGLRGGTTARATSQPDVRSSVRTTGVALPLTLALLSGLISIGLEVVLARLLTIVLEGTIYGLGAVLAVFLAGISAGSMMIGPRLARLRHDPARGYRIYSALMLAAFGFLAIPLMLLPWGSFALMSLERWVTGGMALMHVKLVLCAIVLFPTAVAFGAAFPLVVMLYRPDLLGAGQGLGRLYAVNTVGSVAGSAVVGLISIPLLGSDATMLLLLSALAATAVLAAMGGHARRLALCVAALYVAFVATWPGARIPELMRTHLAHDTESFHAAREAARTRTVYFGEGASGSVAIYGDPRHVWSMWINGLPQAGRRAKPPHYHPESLMLAVAPYALHAAPASALVIGYGGGVTTDALLQCSGIRRIRIVEIEPRVLEAVEAMPWPDGAPHLDPRVDVVVADARNHLQRESTRYDLILAHLSDPWLSGSASLATREFFRLARSRLEVGGIFGLWMGEWGWGEAHSRSVARALSEEFEDVMLLSSKSSYLLASNRPIRLDGDRIAERLGERGLAPLLAPHGLDRAPALLSAIAGMGRAIPTDVPANTDDNAYVEVMLPLLRRATHVPVSDLDPPLLIDSVPHAERFAVATPPIVLPASR